MQGSGLGDVGLDLKYGVTSGLNLDVTLNTDFAQVEVDEQQVNLTRFNLFFPEKREFFLENASQFNVGTRFQRRADLFFSPPRRPVLTGTAGPDDRGRAADRQGRSPQYRRSWTSRPMRRSGRPARIFWWPDTSRDVLSRSKIGGLLVNKESADGTSFNRTFAADANLALGNNFTVNSFLAKTSSPGVSSEDMAFYGRVAWLDPGLEPVGRIYGHPEQL